MRICIFFYVVIRLTCKCSYVADFKNNLCLEMVIYVYKNISPKFCIKENTGHESHTIS